MSEKIYPLGDHLNSDERRQFGIKEFFEPAARAIQAVSTGVKRFPKKGERFISGAVPHAYLAQNDITYAYYIAKLVKTETVTITRIVE